MADNGGGMTPDKMRTCMSLGYSEKSKLANAIGQCELICKFNMILFITYDPVVSIIYQFESLCVSDGNGFKTRTMRLGADVLVFTRNQ